MNNTWGLILGVRDNYCTDIGVRDQKGSETTLIDSFSHTSDCVTY